MLKDCANCDRVFVALGSRSKCCSLRCRIEYQSKRTENGCLEWQGAIGSHGYGVLKIPGSVICVHRAIYEIEHGAQPSTLQVCHTCDNRKCVAIEHLFLGTPRDNSLDMVRKGRHWIKGKVMPEEYRARLRVPKRRFQMMRTG